MKKNDAENIVAHKLELNKIGCAIVPGSTKEYAKCFAVYYQAEKYLETGEFNSMLVGHGAVLVDRVTENIFKTGSAFPTSKYVEAFERSGDPYAERSEALSILQCSKREDSVSAIKYIHTKLNIGLAQSKQYIDTVMEGKSVQINCNDNLTAQEVCEYLNNHGFIAKQLWKSSANKSLQATPKSGAPEL